jgi:hypothetical protein
VNVFRYASSADGRQIDTLLEPSRDELEAFYDYSQKSVTREELQARLGNERFSAFMKFQDEQYREALALSKRFSLPEGVPMEVVALRNEWLASQIELTSKTRDPIVYDQVIKAGLAKLRNRLEQLLGVEGAAAYISDAKHGEWAR